MSTVGGLDGGWSAAQWVVLMVGGLDTAWSAMVSVWCSM